MKRKVTLGVIGAMQSEIKRLLEKMGECQIDERYGLRFYVGELSGQKLVLVKSGVGKVMAARCAQMLIDFYQPDYLVNTGVAGGLSAHLRVGDIVLGAELVQHDFDITAFGYAKGNMDDDAHKDEPTVFRSDETLVRLAQQAGAGAQRVLTGRIATGDVFVAGKEAKAAITAQFAADAAEMEGAAIAQVAAACGVPFLVIRAISDLADGSATESFDTFEQQTADVSAALLEKLAARLG